MSDRLSEFLSFFLRFPFTISLGRTKFDPSVDGMIRYGILGKSNSDQPLVTKHAFIDQGIYHKLISRADMYLLLLS